MSIVKRGYTDIILWGRSMGAVTSLLYMRDSGYFSISKRFVKMLILDSAFCSFTQVTQ
jgi:alpha-beta hydrolase superfamily lysophospholipase